TPVVPPCPARLGFQACPSSVPTFSCSYIIFGVWEYYIAKLGDDMMSLAEEPRRLELDRNVGPYGAGKTDDKPYLHKYGNKYYLSWGCFYAMADDLYGPYVYQGTVINENSFAPGYDTPTWPNGYLQGRHGNYFEWHGQWYYTYCDISQTGNRWFRDAFISYVHYRADGTIAPIRVDGVGVGWHDASVGVIPAEEYFAVEGMVKEEDTKTGFRMRLSAETGHLFYPMLTGIAGKTSITLKLGSTTGGHFQVDLHRGNETGEVLATQEFSLESTENNYQFLQLPVSGLADQEGLTLVFRRNSPSELKFDGFSIR
ncbi:MAG: hypothetical protein AAGA62_16155, partial [Bacteroidota bacterium]